MKITMIEQLSIEKNTYRQSTLLIVLEPCTLRCHIWHTQIRRYLWELPHFCLIGSKLIFVSDLVACSSSCDLWDHLSITSIWNSDITYPSTMLELMFIKQPNIKASYHASIFLKPKQSGYLQKYNVLKVVNEDSAIFLFLYMKEIFLSNSRIEIV